MRKVRDEAAALVMMSNLVILEKLRGLDEAPWSDIRGKPLNDRGLAARLRSYGIQRRVIRIGSTTHKGYRREDFVDAWRRYLPPSRRRKQGNSGNKVTGEPDVGRSNVRSRR